MIVIQGKKRRRKKQSIIAVAVVDIRVEWLQDGKSNYFMPL